MSFLARMIKFILILFILCAAGYFIIFNGTRIEVSFGHLGVIEVPAAVAYIVSFFFGAAIVAAVFGYEFTRQSITLARLRRQVKKLEHKEANYFRSEHTNDTVAQTNQSRLSSLP